MQWHADSGASLDINQGNGIRVFYGKDQVLDAGRALELKFECMTHTEAGRQVLPHSCSVTHLTRRCHKVLPSHRNFLLRRS